MNRTHPLRLGRRQQAPPRLSTAGGPNWRHKAETQATRTEEAKELPLPADGTTGRRETKATCTHVAAIKTWAWKAADFKGNAQKPAATNQRAELYSNIFKVPLRTAFLK